MKSLTSEELVEACLKSGEEAAWREFIRRFQPAIAGTVMRLASSYGANSPAVIDDLVQEMFLKVLADDCRRLRNFKSQGPDAIIWWLKTVAFSVVTDYFRRHPVRRETPLDPYTEQSVSGPDHAKQMEREVLLREIDDILTVLEVRPRDRQIFWLHHRHGMTSRAIAAIPAFGLTQKGVESIIQRLTHYVRERLKGKSVPNPL